VLTRPEARAVVLDIVTSIAPDATQRTRLDDSTRLHEDAGLDSTDLLELAQRLTDRTGITIPEADYCELETVGRAARYLAASAAAA